MWGWFRSRFGGGHDAARETEERTHSYDFMARPQDEERHIGYSRDAIRLACMELDRNHGIFFGANNRIATYSVPRISLQLETSDPTYNRVAEQFLLEWFKNCDIRGRSDFRELMWHAVRSIPTAGDGGFILLDDGLLQPIESELIRTPDNPPRGATIREGVEIDAYGRPIRYWIAPRHPETGYPDTSKCVPVDAANFVFYRKNYRFDSLRGYPAASSAVVDMEDQKSLHRAYVRKTKNEADHLAVVATEDGRIPNNMKPGTGKDETGAEATRPPLWQGNGMKMFFVKTGESVNNVTPTTPNADIVKFEEWGTRWTCAGMGIPYEFIMLDLRGLSWSTSNAVVKMAGDGFREINHWMVNSIANRMTAWRLMKAIAEGDVPKPPAPRNGAGIPVAEYNRVRFGVPEYMWADEREHLAAAREGWQMGAKCLDDIAAERGEKGIELLRRKGGDIESAIQIAKDLSVKTGVPVSWDQIIGTGTPGVVTMAQIEKQNEARGATA